MAKFKQLRDLYRFPGFMPQEGIRGIFGEPLAVVVALRRNRKKQSVLPAAKLTGPVTTNGLDVFGISPVATSVSIFFSLCAGSSVPGAEA
jgi:hypothetical protein